MSYSPSRSILYCSRSICITGKRSLMRSIPAIWWIIPIVAMFQSPAVAQEDLFLLCTAGTFEKVIDQASLEMGVAFFPGDRRLVRSDSSDLASWLKLAEIFMNRQHFHKAVPLLDRLMPPDSVNPGQQPAPVGRSAGGLSPIHSSTGPNTERG